jgi:hypothetical protein
MSEELATAQCRCIDTSKLNRVIVPPNSAQVKQKADNTTHFKEHSCHIQNTL